MRARARHLLHAAALAFTGWALIASSVPDDREPARDCFIDLKPQSKLRVRLAADPAADAGAAEAGTSCHGVDGLAPDSELTLELEQRDRDEGDCYGVHTVRGELPPGMIFFGDGKKTGSIQSLYTSATGTFESPTQAGCSGTWNLVIGLDLRVPPGGLVSPLDGKRAGTWVLDRDLSTDQAQFCKGAFTERGPDTCRDRFIIGSAVEVP